MGLGIYSANLYGVEYYQIIEYSVANSIYILFRQGLCPIPRYI